MTAKLWKPNVTVAAIVEREGRFLLIEEETDDGLVLNQPAGHLEADESTPPDMPTTTRLFCIRRFRSVQMHEQIERGVRTALVVFHAANHQWAAMAAAAGADLRRGQP